MTEEAETEAEIAAELLVRRFDNLDHARALAIAKLLIRWLDKRRKPLKLS